MNERLKELYQQAHMVREYPEDDPMRGGNPPTVYWGGERSAERFAELIVKECIYTLQLKILRNGSTPENLRSLEHIKDIGEKFGIEFPMDYYPDRNKHFGVQE